MNSEERVAILRRGLAVLRALESERWAMLPPPEQEDPSLLREIREVASFADRLEMELDLDGFDPRTTSTRDASLSMSFDGADLVLLRALASESGARTGYRVGPPTAEQRSAIQELCALLGRYMAGEFMPPNSFFGIPEAGD